MISANRLSLLTRKDKSIQQASFRKKVKEHFLSKARSFCVKKEKGLAHDTVDQNNQSYIASACRNCNTVHSLAKRSSFSDPEDEIGLGSHGCSTSLLSHKECHVCQGHELKLKNFCHCQ